MVSIFIDYKLQRFTREIEYSFRHIFQTLGYGYRFIVDTDELKPTDILIIYSMSEPDEENLKAIAKHYITIFIQCDHELYESSAYTPERLRRSLKEIKLLYKTPVVASRAFQNPAENYTEHDIKGGKINFDLIGNVFFHLSKKEQQINTQRNEDGRFPDDNSVFFPYRETPILDCLFWLLDSMIKEHTRNRKIPLVQKQYWPEGQSSAVVFSHTVDDLQKWDLSSIVLSVADDLSLLFTFKWGQLLRTIWGKLQYLFTNYEQYWNFEEFVRLEQENGCRSTYFFATDKGAEIDYSLEDPDIQEEIQQLLSGGNDIGLLLTNDKLNRDDMLTRKQILLHQLNREQTGIRQMGYNSSREVCELHQKITPLYSQSSAFKDSPGYYDATSFPFNPYINGKAVFPILPTVFTDKHLRVNKQKIIDLDDAKLQLKKLFQQVNLTRGIFSLDFSLASYADIHYCPKLYSYILALVKSSPTWLTTATDIVKWWEKRNLITIDEGEYEVSVLFNEGVDHFVLQVLGDIKITEVEGLPVKIDGNYVRFTNVKEGGLAVLRFNRGQ